MDSVRIYFKEIAQVPMLTHAQEVEYGRQVQQMMLLQQAKESLTEKLQREPTLHEWAQAVGQSQPQLSHTLRTGQRARQKMVAANLLGHLA